VAHLAGRPGFRPAPDTSFAAARAAQLDLLGDLVSAHLDTTALVELIEGGAPLGLPFVPPGAADQRI
jgi:adenosylcobyric acid synthase